MSSIWTPEGADPTRVPLEADPVRRHLVGVAIHGNTPFDVPYMSEISDNLWQGGCTNGLILPPTIKHVIALYVAERYTVEHRITSVLSVLMYDSLEQSTDQVDALARWVNACRQDGPTLVHCQAGLNRSSLVVARALILDGMEPVDAIALLRGKRSPAALCNEAFEKWLLEAAS